MSVTFEVDAVEPAAQPLEEADAATAAGTALGAGIEQVAGPQSLIQGITYHPLLATLHLAFSQHRPLALSPDMLWVTLLQGFAHHVKLDPEAHRGLVTGRTAPVKIQLERNALPPVSDRAFWAGVARDLAAGVSAESARAGALEAVRFSTTGPDEAVATRIALLDTFQHYFDYEVVCVCGIPAITLEASPADWLALRRAVGAFRPFGLDWWVDAIGPLLDQFVLASGGRPDPEFFRDIYKLHADYGEDRSNGWFLKFIPYIKDWRTGDPIVRNPLFETDHGIQASALPSGLSSAPVQLAGECEPRVVELTGGVIGATQDPATGTLRPRVGWAVRSGNKIENLVARLRAAHVTAPPLPDARRAQIIDRGAAHGFAGELMAFYARTDGATLFDGAIRIAPLAELLDARGFDRAAEKDWIMQQIRWMPIVRLADGSSVWMSSHADNWGTDYQSRFHPLVHMPAGATAARVVGPVVAASFGELLGDLLAGGGRHLMPGGTTKVLGHAVEHPSDRGRMTLERRRDG